jgi:hypothetical protein
MVENTNYIVEVETEEEASSSSELIKMEQGRLLRYFAVEAPLLLG